MQRPRADVELWLDAGWSLRAIHLQLTPFFFWKKKTRLLEEKSIELSDYQTINDCQTDQGGRARR